MEAKKKEWRFEANECVCSGRDTKMGEIEEGNFFGDFGMGRGGNLKEYVCARTEEERRGKCW
jgi:hypothetical protein